MAKRMSWYDKGFKEAIDGLLIDPPMNPGHSSFENYSAGYRDGERQNERDAWKEAAEIEACEPVEAGPIVEAVTAQIARGPDWSIIVPDYVYCLAHAAGLDNMACLTIAGRAKEVHERDTMDVRGTDPANPTVWARDPIIRKALRLLAANELGEC
jgi:hypothetical protein